VHLALDADQEELRRTVRRFCETHSPEPEVRRVAETVDGYDPAVWRLWADQLGIPALGVPEQYGGAGFGPVELGVVFEEAGRALLCLPFLAGAMATQALLGAADADACERYLPDVAAGETIATLGFLEPGGSFDPDGLTASAQAGPDGWLVSGVKDWVVDGQTADLILVAARTPAGLSLFAVEGSAGGLRRDAVPSVDTTRRVARLTFTRSPATLIGTDGAAGPAVARTLDLAAVLLAAEQVGVAQRALDMAVEYAKTRVQFGRAIGSFQAIKHKLATVLLEVEAARSAAWYAMLAADQGTEDLATVASIARTVSSEAAVLAASENIQVHGGIGMTWEHPAQLYFKRATVSRQLLGDTHHHLQRLATAVIG
jgi:acyl-CoA dehydrogenase